MKAELCNSTNYTFVRKILNTKLWLVRCELAVRLVKRWRMLQNYLVFVIHSELINYPKDEIFEKKKKIDQKISDSTTILIESFQQSIFDCKNVPYWSIYLLKTFFFSTIFQLRFSHSFYHSDQVRMLPTKGSSATVQKTDPKLNEVFVTKSNLWILLFHLSLFDIFFLRISFFVVF